MKTPTYLFAFVTMLLGTTALAQGVNFSEIDTNGDGVLQMEELVTVFGARSAARVAADLDADGDGDVTLAEASSANDLRSTNRGLETSTAAADNRSDRGLEARTAAGDNRSDQGVEASAAAGDNRSDQGVEASAAAGDNRSNANANAADNIDRGNQGEQASVRGRETSDESGA